MILIRQHAAVRPFGRRDTLLRWAGAGFRAGAVLALAAAAACATPRATRPVDLVVENVTVIDPATRRALPNRSVFVRGDRIVAVTRTGRRAPLAAERRVDGAGRFLIPG
jgi:adenine deaminase